ncbi:formamidopyrimidine-DNA glycosylase [Solimonas sp. K1W22B-7]|uniref:Fpg/Nei family DNA glycosylase n=1 Tax=Solimonas sp. K1W22B-7 TaxID=2303331 RepID=UPI000E32FDB9|nr:DNA-formamidopyrimidine glycosylase family protein [Solimonas sp. K1W22B-7]AXQ28666.1 formamidopyrimidine-DNA glycosylase [Solimonas sp. K1W22B-7]
MPELPDLTVYLERIDARAGGGVLRQLRIGNPFVLRTVAPPCEAFAGRRLTGTRRIGKRLVLSFEGGLHAVIHLMVLGRLRWAKAGAALPKAGGLAAFDFGQGSLLLIEHGKKRRAALHLVGSDAELAPFDRGGLEVLDAGYDAFHAALVRENHTLKRALTDPRIFAGIGNAYSDEILHRAQLSPFRQTQALPQDEARRLYDATRAVLREWTERLRREAGENWPDKVTAFRPDMAVHGRYRLPCPVCGAPVQRIVYASNEANYCARCQTGGRLLADRALSRLLHDSWPKTLDEL